MFILFLFLIHSYTGLLKPDPNTFETTTATTHWDSRDIHTEASREFVHHLCKVMGSTMSLNLNRAEKETRGQVRAVWSPFLAWSGLGASSFSYRFYITVKVQDQSYTMQKKDSQRD